MPWMRWGWGAPPDSTGLSAGSTATASNEGFRSLITCATPVIVPPVPTPATSASTSPSVSSQISRAVVRRCTSGFAGLRNCCRMKAFGILSASSLAFSTEPCIPRAPSVSTTFVPKARRVTRRSGLIVSGMTTMHS